MEVGESDANISVIISEASNVAVAVGVGSYSVRTAWGPKKFCVWLVDESGLSHALSESLKNAYNPQCS